jgi:hypothetical protein
MKTIVLDFDDYSVLRSRPDLLRQLKEFYPNLKVSMFTIPFDYEYEMSHLRLNRDEALKFIHNNLDWIQIIPHGVAHLPEEFKHADRTAMIMAMDAIDEQFKKDGLPYVKGFKAPYWLWNKDVVAALDDKGWFGAVDPNQPNMPRTKRYYQYQYSIADPFWMAKEDVLKIHGHMTPPSENNIDHCFLNLMKMPKDAEFKFVTDFIEE